MEKNDVLYEVVLIWTEEEQECGYREEERVIYTTTNREKAEQFINENKKFCGYYVYPGLFGDINEELYQDMKIRETELEKSYLNDFEEIIPFDKKEEFYEKRINKVYNFIKSKIGKFYTKGYGTNKEDYEVIAVDAPIKIKAIQYWNKPAWEVPVTIKNITTKKITVEYDDGGFFHEYRRFFDSIEEIE